VTLGALGPGLGAGDAHCGNAAGLGGLGGALGLAWLAALGIVFELPVEEEDLLSGREDELAVAIYAGK
jgi:hypothetical protein